MSQTSTYSKLEPVGWIALCILLLFMISYLAYLAGFHNFLGRDDLAPATSNFRNIGLVYGAAIAGIITLVFSLARTRIMDRGNSLHESKLETDSWNARYATALNLMEKATSGGVLGLSLLEQMLDSDPGKINEVRAMIVSYLKLRSNEYMRECENEVKNKQTSDPDFSIEQELGERSFLPTEMEMLLILISKTSVMVKNSGVDTKGSRVSLSGIDLRWLAKYDGNEVLFFRYDFAGCNYRLDIHDRFYKVKVEKCKNVDEHYFTEPQNKNKEHPEPQEQRETLT